MDAMQQFRIGTTTGMMRDYKCLATYKLAKLWLYRQNLVSMLILVNLVALSIILIGFLWARHIKAIRYRESINSYVRTILSTGCLTKTDAEEMYDRPEGKITISNTRLQAIIQELKSRPGEHHNLPWAQRCVLAQISLSATRLSKTQRSELAAAYSALLKTWPKDPHHDLLENTIRSVAQLKLFQCKPTLISYSLSSDKAVAQTAKDSHLEATQDAPFW